MIMMKKEGLKKFIKISVLIGEGYSKGYLIIKGHLVFFHLYI